ncbi:unnamed protein product [Agarophyton chilense]
MGRRRRGSTSTERTSVSKTTRDVANNERCHSQKRDKRARSRAQQRRRNAKKLHQPTTLPPPQCADAPDLRRHRALVVPPIHQALVRGTPPPTVPSHPSVLPARHFSHMAEEHAENDSGPHPLQFKWTLWHDFVTTTKGRGGSYAVNLRPIADFDTVEDFWAVFNSLKEPSQLSYNHTYNLFKHGIEPKWEDPQNVKGGEWRVTFPLSHMPELDKGWINTVLTVIGEGFGPQESDDIAGIVMNRKRGISRLAIWTKSATRPLQMSIGHRWRETSGISSDQQFLLFKDSMGTKKPKAKYSIPEPQKS